MKFDIKRDGIPLDPSDEAEEYFEEIMQRDD